jgi:hypothetical protein
MPLALAALKFLIAIIDYFFDNPNYLKLPKESPD